ncbi:hypothetical protein BDV10DRAFT_137557 [Aspergillus recurvatus]
MVYRRQPPKRYACTRCVRHKVKCVPVAGDSGGCQRCTRLGHPSCVFPAEIRGSPTTHAPAGTASSDTHDQSYTKKSDRGKGAGSLLEAEKMIHPDQATTLLKKYIEHKQPHFPFVIIPPEFEITVQIFRQQYPFLLLCVLTAAVEHNPPVQEKLERLVRKEIANRVVVNIERDMDLLMGLLVHAAWYHYHWRSYHTQIYMLLQMAIMVAVDLGLDMQYGFRMQIIPVDGREQNSENERACGKEGGNLVAQSAAGQRALLGCYYLCSISSLFRRQLHMRYTPWIDQCAEALAGRAEHPKDARLRTYIKVQALVRRSQLLFSEEQRLLHPNDSGSSTWEQVTELRTQQLALTENILASLDSDTSDDWLLRIELGGAAALILGQALVGQGHVFKLQEINQLEALTESAQYVVKTFLAAPVSVAGHLPASAYATVWYCLLVLSKLTILFHPDEHQALGVNKEGLHHIGVGVMAKFKKLVPEIGENNFWTSSRNVIATMLAWLEKSDGNGSCHLQTNSAGRDSHGKPITDPSQDYEQGLHVAQQPDTPGNATSMDMWFQSTNYLDDGMWQQMLDNFTWFGPAAGDALGFDHDGI